MEYRTLHHAALNISRVSFGCMSLAPAQRDAQALIDHAIDLGINCFDTADLYARGENERMIGQALKDKRSKVVIATKVGNKWREDGSGWDWYPRKAYILEAADESLKRLQTDYIDLYQLHGGTLEDPFEEILEAFELLKQSGKIREFGISSIRPNVIRRYAGHTGIATIMMQYSLLDRRPEEETLNLASTHGIGVLARGTVANGLLAGKAAKSFLKYDAGNVGQMAAAVASISGPTRNAAQTAMRYVLQNEAISSAVVGIRTMQQLDDAAAVFDTPALTEQELETLKHAIPANWYEEHR